MDKESENRAIMQWCFRRVKHRSTMPFSKGPTTVVEALSSPCAITQATARQHWILTQRPSYGDTSSEMKSLAPLRLHTFRFMLHSYKNWNEVLQILAFTEDFAIKRGAHF